MNQLRVISKLIEVRDQAHVFHWNAEKGFHHEKIGEFYENWTSLMDSFVEVYIGKYGKESINFLVDVNSEKNITQYLVDLQVWLNDIMPKSYDKNIDSDLDNIVADMKKEVNHLLYFLRFS